MPAICPVMLPMKKLLSNQQKKAGTDNMAFPASFVCLQESIGRAKEERSYSEERYRDNLAETREQFSDRVIGDFATERVGERENG